MCPNEFVLFHSLTSFTVGADEEVSLTETEWIRLLADYIQETELIICLLFSTVIILFILILYQCPPIKSTSVLKLQSVNCTCT
jgi:hypothetical protein